MPAVSNRGSGAEQCCVYTPWVRNDREKGESEHYCIVLSGRRDMWAVVMPLGASRDDNKRQPGA